MSSRRSLFGLLLAGLAFFYALGTSGAALACASPQEAAATLSMAPGQPCHQQNKAHDCALACAPLCTAVMPQPEGVGAPQLAIAETPAAEVRQLASSDFTPDPPPPRSSRI